ncbi:hypothetical protein SEVIR_9G252700v4 [Setaria viridis]|uniref:Protein kinase domain-containing protein n=1 Tax=Setaria viridis TaxID=4556 RepID=A0A4U6T032_SETVI|nr:receptor kinase-like protein Xa21 [Setaria viridis]XP_034576305.1 receptor kinase-like protein Xa21 [Setaria viridis]TKV93798.1 hypothetical protein SEVIR_9G252700v2 [Setaria viridis]
MEIGHLTALGTLRIGQNELVGRVPEELGLLRHVDLLDISSNNLHGDIPASLFELRSLSSILNLSHNSLTAASIETIGQLQNIIAIDLSNNLLNSNMSIGQCQRLQTLSLSKNAMSGVIPDSIGTLGALQSLDLSSNKLTGSIPPSLSKLHLQLLNLSFNDLTGLVPSTGNHSLVYLDGNQKLCYLDGDMTAKNGDFGLARLLAAELPEQQSISSIHGLTGSIGYIPPEYGYGSKPSTRGDVYSYGVMLLEMITGKSPLEQNFGGDMNLVKWVRDNYFPRQAHHVIDKRLISATTDAICEGVHESNTEKLLLNCLLIPMIEVALSCVAQSPDERSSMHDSVLRLKQMKETYLRNRSTMYRTRRG